MISRFTGDGNRERVVEAIRCQRIVANDPSVAALLADAAAEVVQVEPVPPRDEFITQGHAGDDLFLILAGSVSVRVKGREVALRGAGECVGEMALIDSSAPRSASVAAVAPTVLVRIPERAFTPVADRHPFLWRNIAREIGARLRERGKWVREVNPRPVVFIGSSAEQRAVAFEIRDGLSYEKCLPKVWTDDLFRPSATSIENLERELGQSDFGVFVVTPDDVVTSRRRRREAPRDNVIWEHGFFTGALGRPRTFLVKPRGADLRLPSDLAGVTPLDYDSTGTPADLRARLGPVINGIRKEVERQGPR